MTAEKTADELFKLAAPALHHAELIQIAKENTPNGAYQVSIARWPPRQAKASRFLAMLRRDHPEVFQRLITPTEHVPPQSCGGEHARGEKDGNGKC